MVSDAVIGLLCVPGYRNNDTVGENFSYTRNVTAIFEHSLFFASSYFVAVHQPSRAEWTVGRSSNLPAANADMSGREKRMRASSISLLLTRFHYNKFYTCRESQPISLIHISDYPDSWQMKVLTNQTSAL